MMNRMMALSERHRVQLWFSAVLIEVQMVVADKLGVSIWALDISRHLVCN
jgi:hypothetical protein